MDFEWEGRGLVVDTGLWGWERRIFYGFRGNWVYLGDVLGLHELELVHGVDAGLVLLM